MNCFKCLKAIGNDNHSIKCDICDSLFHSRTSCTNIEENFLKSILRYRDTVLWLCERCKSSSPIALIRQIPKLVDTLNNLSAKVDKMANAKPSYAEVASPTAVSSNFAQPHNGVDSNSTVSALQEISERQRREQNLVFVNLSANKDAKMAVVDYCVSHLNVSEVKKEEVLYARYIAPKATDKSSITIARFRSKELRDRILTAAKQRSKQDIANSRIYVNPDLTKVQREEFSRLRAEVARRNAAGERVRVMGSRIVKIRDTAASASTENKKDSVAASAKSVQKQPRVRNGQLKTRPAEESDTEERVDLNAAISNDE